MARIRSIKPEFPQSESVGALSRDARLLFIQLWTIVDDEGRARAASRMLASLLYPYDDDAPALIDAWLGELEGADCICRYAVDGSHYLEVRNWRKHQKIDKPSASKLPASAEASVKPRETSRKVAPDLGPRIGTKEEDQEPSSLRSDGARERARGTRIPPDFDPDLGEAISIGIPLPAAIAEADKFRDYWKARAGPGGVKLDWPATWRNWCRKAAEDAGNGPQGRGPPRGRPVNGFASLALGIVEENRHAAPRNNPDAEPAHVGAEPDATKPAAPRLLDAERSASAGGADAAANRRGKGSG